MRATLTRFIEFVFISFALSAIMLCIYYLDIVPQKAVSYGIMFTIAAIAFITIQVKMLRITFSLFEGGNEYYIYNYTAYFMFIITTAIVYKFIDKSYVYTWMFGTTKFLSYFSDKINTVISAAIFHAIMLFAIYLAPAGLKGTVEPEQDIEDEFIIDNAEFLDNSEDDAQWDGTEDYTNNPEKEWYKPNEINFKEDAPEWDGTEDYIP